MTRSCKGLQSQIHIILKFTFIEHEGFNCLARHGDNIQRNFGHGSQGLANLLATLNLFAFALHAVQDCVSDLWRQGRAQAGTRRNFFATLSFLTEWFCFCNWTALFETLLRQRPPRALRSPGGCERATAVTQRASHAAERRAPLGGRAFQCLQTRAG